MESNEVEAITNNVLGTRNGVEAAVATGVARFLMISTDKAVNPTSVMGASKRVAELVVTHAGRERGRVGEGERVRWGEGESGRAGELEKGRVGEGEQKYSSASQPLNLPTSHLLILSSSLHGRAVRQRAGQPGQRGAVLPAADRRGRAGDGDASRHAALLHDDPRGGAVGRRCRPR